MNAQQVIWAPPSDNALYVGRTWHYSYTRSTKGRTLLIVCNWFVFHLESFGARHLHLLHVHKVMNALL